MREWVSDQIRLCKEYDVEYIPCEPESMVGISKDTASNNIPINGLRHLPQGDSSGWYLWSGEYLSNADDFFLPLHARHLTERCPEVIRFLGLAPGYRFLIAGEYVDVWYDKSLLDV